ncbi:MAG: biotin/lipoyl-containing protein [Bacteroidota bacterium]
MKVLIDDKTFQVKHKNGTTYLNDEPVEFELREEPNSWILRRNNRNFRIKIEHVDGALKAWVNDKIYAGKIVSREEEILEKIGISDWAAQEESDVKAPMPGKILQVLCEEKMSVEKDQGLIVLEAMKMENMLKSPKSGTISHLKVSEGDTVEKNQILVTFED